MHKTFKCIIFDFDGTLADTRAGIVATFQETFRHMGLEVPSEAVICSTIGLTLEDGFKAALPSMTEREVKDAAAFYRKIFHDLAIPLTVAFPGAAAVLALLQSEGYRLAIATSRRSTSLSVLCDTIGLSGYFEGLYGADSVENHKPAPDLVLKILEDFRLSPEDALVVGDATFDLLMGQRAGCKVCGVTWGNQSRGQLSSVDPDYLIDSFSELYGIVMPDCHKTL